MNEKHVGLHGCEERKRVTLRDGQALLADQRIEEFRADEIPYCRIIFHAVGDDPPCMQDRNIGVAILAKCTSHIPNSIIQRSLVEWSPDMMAESAVIPEGLERVNYLNTSEEGEASGISVTQSATSCSFKQSSRLYAKHAPALDPNVRLRIFPVCEAW